MILERRERGWGRPAPARGSTAPSVRRSEATSEAGSKNLTAKLDLERPRGSWTAHRRGRLAAGTKDPDEVARRRCTGLLRVEAAGSPAGLLRLRAEMKVPPGLAWLQFVRRAPRPVRPILGPADGLLRAARARRAPVLVRPLPHPLGDLFRADQSHLGTRGGGAASTGRGITLGPGHVTVTADQAGAIPARRCSMALPSAPVKRAAERGPACHQCSRDRDSNTPPEHAQRMRECISAARPPRAEPATSRWAPESTENRFKRGTSKNSSPAHEVVAVDRPAER